MDNCTWTLQGIYNLNNYAILLGGGGQNRTVVLKLSAVLEAAAAVCAFANSGIFLHDKL